MSTLSNRPQNKNFGQRSGRETSKRRHLEFKERYYEAPKLCKDCNNVIAYEKRQNSFCNSSCSASFNNKNRTVNRKSSIQKTRKNKRNFCAVTFILCPTCKNHFRVKNGSKDFCSPKCNPTFYTKKSYRTECKFNIDPKKYPELFNSTLIEKHGWYIPVNKPGVTNLSGVCWDHLFRVEDGYALKLSPEILRHPANAELVPWIVNRSRHVSTITIEQLYERINMWENGQRILPTYYTESI